VPAAQISFDDGKRFPADGSNMTPTMLEVAEDGPARGAATILLMHHERATLAGA